MRRQIDKLEQLIEKLREQDEEMHFSESTNYKTLIRGIEGSNHQNRILDTPIKMLTKN